MSLADLRSHWSSLHLQRQASVDPTLYRGMELRGINQDDDMIEAMRSGDLEGFIRRAVQATVIPGHASQWEMRQGDRGQGVGVHWSTDLGIAKSFSSTEGTDHFTVAMFDSWMSLVIEATYTPGSEVEHPEENSHAYGWNGKDEKEIPLKPGSPLTLVRVHALVPANPSAFLAEYDEEGEARTNSVRWITVPLGLSAVAARSSDGFVSKSRQGVEVWDNSAPDSVFDPDGGRWTCFCVEHGMLINTNRLDDARYLAQHPEEFCEVHMYPDEWEFDGSGWMPKRATLNN